MSDMSFKAIRALVLRHLVLGLLFFLPTSRHVALERRLRGKEEYRLLQEADWVLLSYGKSGRTWFRVMVSRFYQLRHDLPTDHLLEFDNYHRLDRSAPKVLFTHNNYIRDYVHDRDSLDYYRGKKTVLLVRDPRDVAVSQYFQWRYRMRPRKKLINDYPPHGSDVAIYDFVSNEKCGIPRIVTYLNVLADAMDTMGDDLLLIRYEDMRTDPGAVLCRVLDFVGTPGTDEQVTAAVEYAAYENMKKLEAGKDLRGTGQRVKPGDEKNPDSFKVRRGKVGGYRDYFTPEQIAVIDAMVDDHLRPVFGYTRAG
jgi:hypothetical protein